MNQQIFRNSISLIEAMYNDSYKDEIIRFMWGRFKDYSDEQWQSTIQIITDSFKPTTKVPLPSIPDFLAGLETNEDDKALQAMERVKDTAGSKGRYSSVDFGDIPLHAAIQAYGGWIEVAGWGEKEWGFNEKKFLNMYKSMSKMKNLAEPKYLVGVHEETNMKNGWFNAIPQPDKIKLPWSKFGGSIEHKKPENRGGEMLQIGEVDK